MGVRTIGELASYDVVKLSDEFGVLGPKFYQMAQGIDHADVVKERRPKSFSREHTFEADTIDEELISSTIDNLLEDVIEEVRDNGYRFKTLTIKIRYEDFETHTRSKTIPFTSNFKALKDVAYNLLKPFLRSGKSIRLVGVKTSNLVSHEKQKILLE